MRALTASPWRQAARTSCSSGSAGLPLIMPVPTTKRPDTKWTVIVRSYQPSEGAPALDRPRAKER